MVIMVLMTPLPGPVLVLSGSGSSSSSSSSGCGCFCSSSSGSSRSSSALSSNSHTGLAQLCTSAGGRAPAARAAPGSGPPGPSGEPPPAQLCDGCTVTAPRLLGPGSWAWACAAEAEAEARAEASVSVFPLRVGTAVLPLRSEATRRVSGLTEGSGSDEARVALSRSLKDQVALFQELRQRSQLLTRLHATGGTRSNRPSKPAKRTPQPST